VENLTANFARFDQGLMVFGPASFADVSVAGQLSIGGQLILTDNGINVLGADLQIQPLRQGGISFLSGLLNIDESGNLTSAGNATFKGTLFAGLISPIPGNDLTIKLSSNDTGSSGSQFLITNASNSAVLSVNQAGDLIASGAGTFAKLNLNIVAPAFALSPTEVIATGSAGIATMNAHQTEITINNKLVTDKSLIYITPKTNTNNVVLFLLRQTPEKPKTEAIEGSFTVGINNYVGTEIPFNWMIIN